MGTSRLNTYRLIIYFNILPRNICVIFVLYVLYECVNVSVSFFLCVGLLVCRHEYLLHKWKRKDFPKDNSTLQNNKGIIHVLFSCLTCKRSEFPQISNKFKTADHTLYEASGDTSGNMVGSRECQHTRRRKAIIRHQLSPNDESAISLYKFYTDCLPTKSECNLILSTHYFVKMQTTTHFTLR